MINIFEKITEGIKQIGQTDKTPESISNVSEDSLFGRIKTAFAPIVKDFIPPVESFKKPTSIFQKIEETFKQPKPLFRPLINVEKGEKALVQTTWGDVADVLLFIPRSTFTAGYRVGSSIQEAIKGKAVPDAKLKIPFFGQSDTQILQGIQSDYEERLNAGESHDSAFVKSSLSFGLDLAYLVSLGMGATKAVLQRNNPEALLKRVSADTKDVKEWLKGGNLEAPTLTENMKETFKTLSRTEKIEIAKGLKTLDQVSPSRLGQILGVNQAEAEALLKAGGVKIAPEFRLEAPKGKFDLQGGFIDIKEIQKSAQSLVNNFEPKLKEIALPILNEILKAETPEIANSLLNKLEEFEPKAVNPYTPEDIAKQKGYIKEIEAIPYEKRTVMDNSIYNKATKSKLPAQEAIAEEMPRTGEPSEVDKLIAKNKIRVVSRSGRDIYLYKKGDEWKIAQNETQAIERAIAEPKQKEVIFNPEMENLQTYLAFAEDVLNQMPGKQLIKFVSKTTGQLPEVTGKDTMRSLTGNGKIVKNSEFGKKGDQIVQEILGYENSPDVNGGQKAIDDYVKAKKKIKDAKSKLSEIRQEIKETKIKEAKPVSTEQQIPALIQGEPGWVKSIEIQAKQAISIANGEEIPSGVSFPKIISQTVTPVQKRVHFIDTFLRTPNRIMAKIGFANEAKELRTAMDGYWKELPKNIEKISEWAKQVSKESNERIFKFLDGQAITLRADEAKVANEIKNWLKEWAKRLNLPEDKRVSDYITHIFDKEFTEKGFDEELAKIITDKIPGSVYNPFTLKRLGAKGYIQDTWKALDAYVKRGTRKAYLDPVLEKIQAKAGHSLDTANIEKSQYQYIQKYISGINMRPTDFDESVDNIVRSIFGNKFGQRPITSLTKIFRQATYRGMLGLNFSSALRNISQGINTYSILGEKYTMIGYANLFKNGSIQELKNEGVFNAGFIQDKTLSATKKVLQAVDKGLFILFDTAEKINRGAAYFGAKSKGLSQGMTEDKAIEYAKEIARKTQFVFDSVDTPVGMQSDIMKTLFQFQTFTTKQIEFLAETIKDKNFTGLIRYILGGLLFVYIIGKSFGMEPKELAPWYRFSIPASLKFPVETWKALLNAPGKYGQERTTEQKIRDVGKSLIGLIPAGIQIKKTVEGYQAIKKGEASDISGRKQFDVGGTLPKNIQALFFGKYASQEAKDYFNKVLTPEEQAYKTAIAEDTAQNQKAKEEIQPVYDKIQKLKSEGKNTEAISLFDSLTKEQQTTYKKYKTSEKTKETIQGKKDIFPIYEKVQQLKSEGKNNEAIKTYDDLTDEQKRYYQLLKKQLQ